MNTLKSGFVTVVGRPNVGKSTLLNAVLGQKVSIVSNVPQTTRYVIRAVLNTENTQIVFVDTPGIHLFKYKLSSELNAIAFNSLQGVEVILYMVDCSRQPQAEEEKIMDILIKSRMPVIMALNKIDKSRKFLNDYIELWQDKTGGNTEPVKYFIPVSALQKININDLLDAINEFLPEQEPYYSKDTVTDFPLTYRVADIIREKLCSSLRQELPHQIAVEVEDINQQDKIVHIFTNIIVNSDSQKSIVVGSKGSMVKNIGILSRRDLEELFEKKVFLKLKVKVEKDWHNKLRILRQLGYTGI